MSTVVSTSW